MSDHLACPASDRGFTVQTARYAKGKMLVCVTDSRDGLKGRSSYLLDALNARYTHREHGYILSPGAVEKLIALYDAGFDARVRVFRDSSVRLHKGNGRDMSLPDALKTIGFKPTRKPRAAE